MNKADPYPVKPSIDRPAVVEIRFGTAFAIEIERVRITHPIQSQG